MEDVPRRKHRRKLKNRPSYLSRDVLDKAAAVGMAHLLELVEKQHIADALELLIPKLPEITVDQSIAISERGRAAILTAYEEGTI